MDNYLLNVGTNNVGGYFSSEQIDLLKSEGVTFKDDFCVDLKKHQWNI